MDLKPGSRWKSAVCDAEVVVVLPPKTPGVLTCGGHPLVSHAKPQPEGLTVLDGHGDGCGAGKRLFDPPTSLELLCTKGGAGSLSFDGRRLELKQAKALPSSD